MSYNLQSVTTTFLTQSNEIFFKNRLDPYILTATKSCAFSVFFSRILLRRVGTIQNNVANEVGMGRGN